MTSLYSEFWNAAIHRHNALQIGAVLASVADYLLRPDRTQIWIQNSLNKNGSNVADLYAALRRCMRTAWPVRDLSHLPYDI